MSSAQCAQVVLDEFVRQGITDVVLCPGSRSAPLAYAAAAAADNARVRLHVRVDERSAGFLALGLAKLTRRPAPIITTSGTAVANLHPAVLEAHHAAVPLILLTADRPPQMLGTGANQTTSQSQLFGAAVRLASELATPSGGDAHSWEAAGWRTSVARSWSAALGLGDGLAGPVHLNLPLAEPLVPDGRAMPPGRADAAPWVRLATPAPSPPGRCNQGRQIARPTAQNPGAGVGATPEHTLVIIGDLPTGQHHLDAVAWAATHGWPIISEPVGVFDAAQDGPLPGGSLLLATPWLERHQPERVVVVGRPTLSRAVAALLRRPGVRVEVISPTLNHPGLGWTDVAHQAAAVHPWGAIAAEVNADTEGGAPTGWGRRWLAAAQAVSQSVETAVTERDGALSWPSGPAIAHQVLAALPPDSVLFLGSSNAVRDADAVRGLTATSDPRPLTLVASRGLAGIDGCVSTACGLALATAAPTYALLGDLTFLHDSNGLLIGPTEAIPDLTVVVVNDQGGGIFSTLEYGDPSRPERQELTERVFGTPTGTDLSALSAAHTVTHTYAATPHELHAALARPPQGLAVVEVPADRTGHRAARTALAELATRAVHELS